MSRLFWKFFLAFLAAQVVTVALVGVSVWVLHPFAGESFAESLRPPQHSASLFPVLAPLLIGGITSLVFAGSAAIHFVRPIKRIRRAFQVVSLGNFDERIGSDLGHTRDELQELGTGFDRMAETLQLLVERQRRLFHDVSHEMRAPLARLQAAGALLERDQDNRDQLLRHINAEVARVSTLVDELLTLARWESSAAGYCEELVTLRDFLLDIASDAQVEAEAKGAEISVSCPADLVIGAQLSVLHRGVENVIRNAIRFSPPDSTILVRALQGSSEISIQVLDSGPGVNPSDLDAIFEPFFRSSDLEVSGFGLGLAIASRAAQVHGGTISAANRESGGLCVTLQLPLDRLAGGKT